MDNVYGYDADGNIISITDIKDLDNPTVQVFAYDDLNRLISMGTTTAALSYQDTDRVIQPDTGAGKDTYYGTVYVTGGAPNDTIARIGGWSDDYYSYFQFPLDNLPDSSDISSAHLYLYNQNANNYNEAKLLRITSPWTESGVTSASNPSSNDYGMSWQAVPDNDWWDADVTQLVKDWDNGTYDNYGVKVVGRYDNGDLVKAFLTSDSSDAAHRPKLVITGVNDTSGVPDITLGATTTPVYAYTYGALGNMLSATGQGAYAYAGTGYANPHAATSIGATSLSYDQNGNLIAEGGSTYAWDYANRLASSTGASYAYNHLDQRVSKVVDGTTTYYPNSLYTASAATTTKNIYMGDTLVASVEGAGTSTAVLSYLYQDHLGSTRFATDDFGNLTQSLDYAPYGGESTSTSRDTTDRHYIGQEYDEESNLSYMNARYYEGSRGQFLSQDPVFHEIGLTPDGKAAMLNPQLMNSYSYAGNNPITSKDPTGRFIEISAGGTLPIGISGSVGIRFDNTGLNLFASGGAGTGLGGSLFSIGYVPGQEVSHNLESTVNIGGSGSVFVGTDVSVGGKYNPRSLSLENSSTQVMYVAGARAGAEAYVRKEVSVPILGRQSNINLPLSATPGMSTPNYTASNRAPVSSNQTYITSQAAAVSNISQAFNPTNAAQVQSLNNFMSNFGGSSKSTKKN
jgi:RHS repeat-associated protein